MVSETFLRLSGQLLILSKMLFELRLSFSERAVPMTNKGMYRRTWVFPNRVVVHWRVLNVMNTKKQMQYSGILYLLNFRIIMAATYVSRDSQSSRVRVQQAPL